jgi:glucosamine-6-phosphate deaminase
MKRIEPTAAFQIDNLKVRVYRTRAEMGEAAAHDVASALAERLALHQAARMIFAAAPSQNEVLAGLATAPGIDWSKVTAFHMDEYIGLPANPPQCFGRFLDDRFFSLVRPGAVHFINGQTSDDGIAAECVRYADLIQETPIDFVCLGIGENGHLAFNDPPVANFNDRAMMKPVELDLACRRQQVNDGCFLSLEDVPKLALTLTIPTILSGERLFCVVPGKTKREAVRRTLHGEVSTTCPASSLRRHPDCTLYLDAGSFGEGGS